MKKKLALILSMLMVLTSVLPQFGVAFANVQNTSSTEEIYIAESAKKEETQILVKYKQGVLKDELKALAKSELNFVKIRSLKFYKNSEIELLGIDSADDISLLKAYLENSGKVEFAEINQAVSTEFAPIDEGFGEKWGLSNTGQIIQGIAGKTGIDIDVKAAWEETLGNETVVIGIMDTGIDINHKDLKDRIFVNTLEIAGNGFDDDGNGYVDDYHGYDFAGNDSTVFDSAIADAHGTHLAGVITGVAPNVRILPLKFIDNGKGYVSDALDAIEYAQMMGVKVINCSFGTYYNSPSLRAAIEASDMLFVCAAGNNGANTAGTPVYPAAYQLKNTISVGAVNNRGLLTNLSNYGKAVEIAAPGESILSIWPNNAYSNQSGTSIATAFVTGVAALLQSQYSDISAQEMKARLLISAKPLPELKGLVQTGGIVSAKEAISCQ